jgi:hypothetical protein
MANFNAVAVRFGRPGLLRIAPLGTAEPTAYDDAWPAGWIPLGYTSEGSVFNNELTSDTVEVAEELDVFARVTTGRNASVEAALAEKTYQNLTVAYNGGILEDTELGSDWEFEPPDLGAETRIMMGWDEVYDPTQNELRIIFRQVYAGGTVAMENRKGNVKSVIPVTFFLEKPATGKPVFKILGSPELNPARATS